MRCRPSRLLLGALCLFLAGHAFAGGGTQASVAFNATDAQSLNDQAAAVHAGMQPGGRYAFLSSGDRFRVNRRLDEMAALFQRRGAVSAMTAAERVQLFNAQQDTARLLSSDGSNRWFCEQAASTGSHVPRTRCWPLDDT